MNTFEPLDQSGLQQNLVSAVWRSGYLFLCSSGTALRVCRHGALFMRQRDRALRNSIACLLREQI